MKFVMHFLHHMMFCFIGCTAYHLLDAYFRITTKIFYFLGIGFAP